jgi:hypothetical protein
VFAGVAPNADAPRMLQRNGDHYRPIAVRSLNRSAMLAESLQCHR